MNKKQSFQSNKTFRDPINFPHGLYRCGEFTRAQAELIEKHGVRYQALELGLCLPIDEEEEAFVEFCRGQKKVDTIHEKTWHIYRSKTGKKKDSFILGSFQSNASMDDSFAEYDF